MRRHGCRFRRRKQRSRQKDGMSRATTILPTQDWLVTCIVHAPLTLVATKLMMKRTKTSGRSRRMHRRGSTLGGRPFGARRVRAKQEIARSDSSLRVRYARSVTSALTPPVHAAMAGVEVGYYSQRQRKVRAESDFPQRRPERATREPSNSKRCVLPTGPAKAEHYGYRAGVGGGSSPSRHAALFVLGTVSPVPPQQYTVHFAGGL